MNNTTAEILVKGIEDGTIKIITCGNMTYERISEYAWIYNRNDVDGNIEGVIFRNDLIDRVKTIEDDDPDVYFYRFTMNDILCASDRIISPKKAEIFDAAIMHHDRLDCIYGGDGRVNYTWHSVDDGTDHWLEIREEYYNNKRKPITDLTVTTLHLVETMVRMEYSKRELEERLNLFESGSIRYSE